MDNIEEKINKENINRPSEPSLEWKDLIPVYGLFRLVSSERYKVGERGTHNNFFPHMMILSAYNSLILLGAGDLYKYLAQ